MRHENRRPGKYANNAFFAEKKKLEKDKKRKPIKVYSEDEKRAILADIEMKLRNDWDRVQAIKSSGIGEHEYYLWRRRF